jgi:hypothetical protein
MTEASAEAPKRTISLTRALMYGHIVIGPEPLDRQEFDAVYNALHRIEAGATDKEYQTSLEGEVDGTDIRMLVNSDNALLNHGRTAATALQEAGVELELDQEIYRTAEAQLVR